MINFFKHYVPATQVYKTSIEYIVLILSIPIGVILSSNSAVSSESSFFIGIVYATIVITIMSALGLYNRHIRESFKSTSLRVFVAFVLVFFIMSALFYSLPDLALSRMSFFYALIISIVGISISRVGCFYLLKHDLLSRKRILIYGAGHRAMLISHLRRQTDKQNYKCIGYIALPDEVVKVDQSLLIDMPDNLFEYAKTNAIEEIIVALDDKRKSLPIRELLDCKVYGIEVSELASFFEKNTGRIKLQSVHPSNLVFSNGFTRSIINEKTKRMVDLLSSLCLFSVTWPVMLLTALAIMIESKFKGSVFYSQTRVGHHNENFNVLKFRSMSMDAEKDGAQWAQENDSRVTRVGNFIRKVRIDELPQLFNVIKGDMSFVGPRPERPEFVDDFSQSIQFYEIRHFVKPGITGWAQVCYPYGATVEDTKNKLEFDLYYLKNYSLFLDVMIILQTIQVVLWGKGAR